jgi:RimJ/RimL family protein N-acetyltransferase
LFPYGKPEREVMGGLTAGAHRRGYATEAAETAREWVYHSLGWLTAVSYIAPENRPFQRVAQRLGARPDDKID